MQGPWAWAHGLPRSARRIGTLVCRNGQRDLRRGGPGTIATGRKESMGLSAERADLA